MAKNVYSYYKERLTKIGGDSKALCLASLSQENACDIGKLLSGRDSRISEFTSFLSSNMPGSLPPHGFHPNTLLSQECS